MTQEELQKKHDQLVEKVRKMRESQKWYFQYKGKEALSKAKRYEREVDDLIDQEIKIQKSNQKELF